MSSEPASRIERKQPQNGPAPSLVERPEQEPGEVMLKVEGVGKRYRPGLGMLAQLKNRITGKEDPTLDHWAVRDVSFELRRGESFAIIGRNGSGKSTLLQMIAGNLQLTTGRIEVEGRVGALLELGAGFNHDFTGLENVRLQGVLMGFDDDEIEALIPTVREFADIGAFFDEPVRTYSSGMFVRLAFAVQVQTRPDILIVDEALSVGDQLFQKRCFQKMAELQREGVTLLFVSHNPESVRTLTRRALLLDAGKPVMVGSSSEVLLAYRKVLHDAERATYDQLIAKREREAKRQEEAERQLEAESGATPLASANPGEEIADDQQYGDGYAKLTSVKMLDAEGNKTNAYETRAPMRIRVAFKTLRDCNHLNIAVRIRNKQGVKLYSWGTLNQDIAIRAGIAQGDSFWDREFAANTEHVVTFDVDCRLGPDFYEVQASISYEGTPDYLNQRMLHWRDEAAFFQVTMPHHEYWFGGVCDLQMRASWQDD